MKKPIVNSQEILFRGSSWGNLIKNDRSGKEMGGTAKKECVKIYAAYRGRRDKLKNKYVKKGNAREEDSITLLSRITKTLYKKNTTRIKNEFFEGEPDLFVGPKNVPKEKWDIHNAEETLDTKTSWSYITFLEAKAKCESDDVVSSYYWQGQCYMKLTGAKKHTIAYCLVNATHKIINDELRALQWELGVIDPDNITDEKLAKEYAKEARQIELNHIFDRDHFEMENPGYDFIIPKDEWIQCEYDIPMEERISTIEFKRSEADINRMIGRAMLCRVWIQNNFFKK